MDTELDVCGEFLPGACAGMFCANCSCPLDFHSQQDIGSFHSQEEIPIDDTFWDELGPLRDLFVPDQDLLVGSFHSQEEIPIDDYSWDEPEPLSNLSVSDQDLLQPSLRPPAAEAPSEAGGAPEKRHRMKYAEKEVAEMEKFAQTCEWRRRRRDKARIEEFCQRIGVPLEKYGTWLKNRKQAARKKERIMA